MDILEKPECQKAFPEKCQRYLLQFLQKINHNFPSALRDAIAELGFPEDPNVDELMKADFPGFDADVDMKACICLINHLQKSNLPIIGSPMYEDETCPPHKKAMVMLTAFTLLRDFIGDGGRTKKYLRQVEMTDSEKKSVDMILTGRERWLQFGTPDYDEIEPDISPAWEWFRMQARDTHSICGLAFRLVITEAIPLCDLRTALEQLGIRKISRCPSTENNSADASSTDDEDRGH
jgi:hypothetical protein